MTKEPEKKTFEMHGQWYMVSRIENKWETWNSWEWETMIFPADKDGNVTDWSGLYCSREYEELDYSIDMFSTTALLRAIE
mgnify:CR=1 FL=1